MSIKHRMCKVLGKQHHGRCAELCTAPLLEELLQHKLKSTDSEVRLPGFASCLSHVLTLKTWVFCSALCGSALPTMKRDDKRIYPIGQWGNELIYVKDVDQCPVHSKCSLSVGYCHRAWSRKWETMSGK